MPRALPVPPAAIKAPRLSLVTDLPERSPVPRDRSKDG